MSEVIPMRRGEASLRLAKDLALPILAATETFAIIGRRGSGKTHTAVVMAEELLAAGVQIAIIDPLDAWWGLRAGKDGAGQGYPIYVVGGSHGDLKLQASSGAVLADAVVDHGLSVVLSLRHLSKTDQRRFVGEFCDRLYDRKGEPAHRTTLHVFIDEADAFVPQRLVPGSERAFGAVDTLIRRGRSSGLATTLISQRPQVINKDVLSQTEVLVAHQLTGPQDRKALEAWIEANDVDDRRAEFMASLASLPKGTAWFWSPGLLEIFRRINVRDRLTFDSSATPKPGARAITTKDTALADVDLRALEAKLAATIEKAKADDPRELRKHIAELQRDLSQAQRSRPAPAAAPLIEHVDRPVLTDKDHELLTGLAARLHEIETNGIDDVGFVLTRVETKMADITRTLVDGVRKALHEEREAFQALLEKPSVQKIMDKIAAATPVQPRRQPLTTTSKDLGGGVRPAARVSRPASQESSGDRSRVEQKVLNALAELDALGVSEPRRIQVAFMADYSNLKSTGFARATSLLSSSGLIRYPSSETMALTDSGSAAADAVTRPRTPAEIQARVVALLPPVCGRLLEPLLEAYPAPMGRMELARAANYSNLKSTGFARALSQLSSLGFVVYPDSGTAAASPVLFLEGR